MKHTNLELIKKIIININKNIDVNIKLSELKFVNKSVKSISLKKTENEFINLMSKLILYKKAKTKLELISNYNTISTILDRLSVEKTKYYHFKYNMNSVLSKKQIKSKCNFQNKVIKKINNILEFKFQELIENKISILKEERTFK
tara:strand:- start:68 stop:502 length:435 start_codon:yes stop_codon:yes gene_type:complete